jgi:hypothetical protein
MWGITFWATFVYCHWCGCYMYVNLNEICVHHFLCCVDTQSNLDLYLLPLSIAASSLSIHESLWTQSFPVVWYFDLLPSAIYHDRLWWTSSAISGFDGSVILECYAHMLIKVKVKYTLVQALRLCTGCTVHRGSRGIALPFHDHGTRTGWGVSVMPWQLFTSKKDLVPIVQDSGWAPGLVWTGAENLAPTWIWSPDHPASSH